MQIKDLEHAQVLDAESREVSGGYWSSAYSYLLVGRTNTIEPEHSHTLRTQDPLRIDPEHSLTLGVTNPGI